MDGSSTHTLDDSATPPVANAQHTAAAKPGHVSSLTVLCQLDWPVKCLAAGLPTAYATRIASTARDHQLCGSIHVLRERAIYILLKGPRAGAKCTTTYYSLLRRAGA